VAAPSCDGVAIGEDAIRGFRERFGGGNGAVDPCAQPMNSVEVPA